MPLTIPTLDDRKYQDLLDEALARIPVHTPEWTNFNKSDPGVTLIEVFAFLTENLLYRSNQIPERNRLKFLKLLGVPLQPAASARGLVTFSNDRGPLQTITLNSGMEVRAGQVPFRTETGLDVLPIESQAFYKSAVTNPSTELLAYYNQLYASFLKPPLSSTAQLYETVQFPPRGTTGVDLGDETVDKSLWIALLVRSADKPVSEDLVDAARQLIGGKTLSLGIVPALINAQLTLPPGGAENREGMSLLTFEIPVGGSLPDDASRRVPQYRSLDAVSGKDVLAEPGVVEITLPAASDLKLWDNLDPLESGVKDFPPSLDDTNLNDRLITWIRIRSSAAVQSSLLWVGINAAFVTQKTHVSNELLPAGTGAPDQSVVLSKKPVVPGSVRITVTANGTPEEWEEIDDLTAAGPEVPVRDPRKPPGTPLVENDKVKVFMINAESGEVRFGDGLHGARPPLGSVLRADYDYGAGADGNVNASAVNTGPALPAGMKVTNPVATWGGAAAETAAVGEKQISRYLQHRDRLVSMTDFETIVLRTPGVHIGRVDVLPAFHPELGSNDPGDAPGAVTLMIVPSYDPLQPDAPQPDRLFLGTICDYIDSRRLVTTEIFLRGPVYKEIWVSAGINVVAGKSFAEVREAVKAELLDFLSPLPTAGDDPLDAQLTAQTAPTYAHEQKGWPLRKPVVAMELLAVASRVDGVSLVNDVLLAVGTSESTDQVDMRGLDLPRVMGLSISLGEPAGLEQLRGTTTSADGTTTTTPVEIVPVPVVPEECE